MKELTEKEEAELRGFIEGVIYSLTQSCKNIQEATHAVDLIMDKIKDKREKEKEIIGYSITDPTKAYYFGYFIEKTSEEERKSIDKKLNELCDPSRCHYMTTENYKLLFIGQVVRIVYSLQKTNEHPDLKIIYFKIGGEYVWAAFPSEAVETHYRD